jgi:hypothetical protein
MRTKRSQFLTTFAAAFGLVFSGLAMAYQGHDHSQAAQGGATAHSERHHFEVKFSKTGLTLAVHGRDHKPVDISHVRATATFFHPNSPKPWFTRTFRPVTNAAEQSTGSLDLPLNLSRVPATGAKVTFQVTGLTDPGESTVTFTVPFTLASEGSITVAKITKADEKAIATQKVCPVSGEELGGEMGPPVKVTRGERSIFLCCKNCLKKVQANPDKYFGSASEPRKEEHEHHDSQHQHDHGH